jgi:hypothetical protein
MASRCPDFEKAHYIRNSFSDMRGPLLNLVDLVIECVVAKEFDFISRLANQEYAGALKRDPSLYEKINTICLMNFNGRSIKPSNPMQDMMAKMF